MLPESGVHCEKYGPFSLHVLPCTQHVGPFHVLPPHWAYMYLAEQSIGAFGGVGAGVGVGHGGGIGGGVGVGGPTRFSSHSN